jgi:Mg-chelatase subunit ChlD
MTANWVRRTYDTVGVTQSPSGAYLATLQELHIGKVLLCIDVSSSMTGRLGAAVAGAREFVTEATEAHYLVGLVLWNHGINAYVPLSRDADKVEQVLRRASSHGGTNVTPVLELGIRELGPLAGDRVMAVFGDGDVGPVGAATDAARRAAALGIRIIVRGLGDYATAQLNQIAADPAEATVLRSVGDIRAGIATMVSTIKRYRA